MDTSSAPHPPFLQLRLRLQAGADIALGPGKAELLAGIAASGSIAGAARQMGMSYRRAWLLVDTMNRCFVSPLVTSASGGSRGGGARLTPLGEEVLARYQAMVTEAEAAARREGEALLALLKPSA